MTTNDENKQKSKLIKDSNLPISVDDVLNIKIELNAASDSQEFIDLL